MSTPADDAAGLLDRVREVVPLIAERAADAEEQRKPDDDVIEALKRTGVFRSFVPKQYGGYEIDIELFVDIGVAVSEACPSTGWITTFYMEHNWLLGMFEEDLRREIFTAQPFILAPGTVNPSGEATPPRRGLRALRSVAVRHGRRPRRLGDLVGHGARRGGAAVADVLRARRRGRGEGHVARRRHGRHRQPRHRREVGVRSGQARVERSASDVASRVDEPYLRRIPMLPFLALTAAIPSLGCARRSVELFGSA